MRARRRCVVFVLFSYLLSLGRASTEFSLVLYLVERSAYVHIYAITHIERRTFSTLFSLSMSF
jgi:hypothetical protein